jgi:hypothetical protein
MVLDPLVWYGCLGGEIAFFVVWIGVCDVDGAHRYAFESAVGGFDGSRDVGYVAVSGDV